MKDKNFVLFEYFFQYFFVSVNRLEKEYTAMKSKEHEDQVELRVSCFTSYS